MEELRRKEKERWRVENEVKVNDEGGGFERFRVEKRREGWRRWRLYT